MISRRHFLDLAAGGSVASLLAAAPAGGPTPDQVHLELVQGNRRFVAGHPHHPHSSPSWARRTGKFGQHPHGVILCCSDSRVAPEIIFDQGIGDFFIVRVVGNVANEDEIASVEYAVGHLGVPLCVVLGHTNCGAATAVVEGGPLHGEMEHLLASMRRAHQKAKGQLPQQLTKEAMIQATVQANVVETIQTLSAGTEVLRERIESRRLRIEGGVYDLVTGHVSWVQREEHRSR